MIKTWWTLKSWNRCIFAWTLKTNRPQSAISNPDTDMIFFCCLAPTRHGPGEFSHGGLLGLRLWLITSFVCDEFNWWLYWRLINFAHLLSTNEPNKNDTINLLKLKIDYLQGGLLKNKNVMCSRNNRTPGLVSFPNLLIFQFDLEILKKECALWKSI